MGPGSAGSAGGSSAVSKGRVGPPPLGALIIATERNTSGRMRAHHAATGEPKSWPMTAATSR